MRDDFGPHVVRNIYHSITSRVHNGIIGNIAHIVCVSIIVVNDYVHHLTVCSARLTDTSPTVARARHTDSLRQLRGLAGLVDVVDDDVDGTGSRVVRLIQLRDDLVTGRLQRFLSTQDDRLEYFYLIRFNTNKHGSVFSPKKPHMSK